VWNVKWTPLSHTSDNFLFLIWTSVHFLRQHLTIKFIIDKKTGTIYEQLYNKLFINWASFYLYTPPIYNSKNHFISTNVSGNLYILSVVLKTYKPMNSVRVYKMIFAVLDRWIITYVVATRHAEYGISNQPSSGVLNRLQPYDCSSQTMHQHAPNRTL